MSIEQQFFEQLVIFAVTHIFYIFVGLGSIRYHIALFGISNQAILDFWKQLKFPFDYLYTPPNPEESVSDFEKSKISQGLSLALGFSLPPVLYIVTTIYGLVRYGLLEQKFSYSEISLDILWIFLYIAATLYFLLLGRKLIKIDRQLSLSNHSPLKK
ncbi:MAG: hypothetical protein ABI947_02240 [Chloroflexota bacterium]